MAEYQAVPKEAITKLEDQLLTCNICRGVFNDPKRLPCAHAYCKDCLERLANPDQQGQISLKCPECREITLLLPPSTVADLPVAFHINQLSDLRDAMRKKPEIVNGLLQSLDEDLKSLAPNWYKFGLYLGVPKDTLKGLEGEDSMVERCFIDMLSAWLIGGGASVENLVAALKTRRVAQTELARKILADKKNMKLALPFLMSKLSPCKPEWFNLGLALGIKDEELRKFENEKKSPGVGRCLHDTLKIWLDSEESEDADKKATLVMALKECGEGELSSIIELKY